jgi:hypothetical protein
MPRWSFIRADVPSREELMAGQRGQRRERSSSSLRSGIWITRPRTMLQCRSLQMALSWSAEMSVVSAGRGGTADDD